MPIDTRAPLLKHRRTKIVATLGPASSDPAVIAELISAGVNVFRLNMSHGDHEGHRTNFGHVRAAAAEAGEPVAILADLCGPKIRVGTFPEGAVELKEGTTVTVTTRRVDGSPTVIPSRYESLAADVDVGHPILLDDGKLELRVESIDGSDVRCLVVRGGRLSNRKGMNLPATAVSAPSLTEKDRVDARFALELGVEFLALSFVRRADDVADLKRLIDEVGGRTEVIAKIEKPEALDDIDAILDLADGIMVARGDLGVELPPEEVPLVQDRLVDLARRQTKPVIVATQMLESMIDNARPTRAEVSDVAGAVKSGADAVMLSAETAAGKHPVEAVRMMDLVARRTETAQWHAGGFGTLSDRDATERPLTYESALSRATSLLARDLLVRSIAVISTTGRSPAVMAASRPAAPMVAILCDDHAARVANLLWGSLPMTIEGADVGDAEALACRVVQERGLAEPGQSVLLVRGFRADPSENRPSVTILDRLTRLSV